MERAGVTFPTVVDSANVLGELFGYKAIPNGIFLDERGVVRWRKFGGFTVANTGDVGATVRLLAQPAADEHPSPTTAQAAAASTPQPTPPAAERMSALQRGLDLLRQGDRAGAVAAWRHALRADPDSFIVRKQIWAVENPERFYPTIDWGWQKEQLAREREAERRPG